MSKNIPDSDSLTIGNVESLVFTVQPGHEYIQIFVSTTYWVTLLARFFEVAAAKPHPFLGEENPIELEAPECLAELVADRKSAIELLQQKLADNRPNLSSLTHEFNRLLKELEGCQKSIDSGNYGDISAMLRVLSPEARSLLATLRIQRTLSAPGPQSLDMPEYWLINLAVFAAPAGSAHDHSGNSAPTDVVKRIDTNQSLLLRHEQRLHRDVTTAGPGNAPNAGIFSVCNAPLLTLSPSPPALSRTAKHPAGFVLRRTYVELNKQGSFPGPNQAEYEAIGPNVWIARKETHVHMICGYQPSAMDSDCARAIVESCQLKATIGLQAECVRDVLQRNESSQASSPLDVAKQSDHEESLVERLHATLAAVAQHTASLEGLASSCTLLPNPYRTIDLELGLNAGVRHFIEMINGRIEHVGKSYLDKKKEREKAKERLWKITQSAITGLAGFELAEAGSKIYLNHIDRNDRAFFLAMQVKSTPEGFEEWLEKQDSPDPQSIALKQTYPTQNPGSWQELHEAIGQFHAVEMQISLICLAVFFIVALLTYHWRPAGDHGAE